MSSSRKSVAGVALIGSLLLHALAILIAAVILAWGILSQAEAEDGEEEEQFVYITPEMVEEVMAQDDVLDDDPNQYIRTTQNTASETAPDKAAFVSDRDTQAASETGAVTGELPMPTQDGVEIPTNELADRNHKDGEIQEDASTGELVPTPEGAAPSPEVKEVVEQPVGEETEEVESDLDDKVEELLNAVEAVAEKKGEEEVEPVEEQPLPEQTPSVASNPGAVSGQQAIDDAFQPETRKNKVEGTISNRGDAAVDAQATPIGRYMRSVTSAVEKRWHVLRKQNADFVTYGNLRVRFHVNRSGKAEDINIVNKDANAVMADFTLKSVMEAEIPPMPEDIVGILEGERLEITYDIIIY